MATTEEITRQVEAFQRSTFAVRSAILSYVARSWLGLGSWRDGDVDRWVAGLTPVLAAGLLETAALTDAHLANVIAAMAEDRPRPAGVNRDDVTLEALRGVPAAEVYRRAGETVWSELSRGVDLADAVARGLDRANRIVETDLQLAKTHTARKVLSSDNRVVGYRRVLTGRESCVLCTVASTQRYRTDRLMDIHTRCDCGVAPIIGDLDPGRVINRELLAKLKAAGVTQELALTQAVSRGKKRLAEIDVQLAGIEPGPLRSKLERRRAGVQRTFDHRKRQLEEYRGEHDTVRTVSTHEHGEIGPVLTDATHDFTPIGDLP